VGGNYVVCQDLDDGFMVLIKNLDVLRGESALKGISAYLKGTNFTRELHLKAKNWVVVKIYGFRPIPRGSPYSGTG